MHLDLLWDIVIILGLASAVVLICQRLRLPMIVGFLVTGMLAGPHGLSLVSEKAGVETLAEVGVVLLLFTIGMEFSFRHLLMIKRLILLGGSLQVGLTFLAALLVGWMLGATPAQSAFWGFLAALSSTAIVLKWLQEKAALDAPNGRASLAILIFQDLVVIPMMLLTPILGGAEMEGGSGWIMAAKGVGVLAALGVIAKWVAPAWMNLVASTRNREMFIIAVVLLCFAVAWLTSLAGLSLALGAFMAGLIISESPYSHQATGNILPLRDIFTSIFFVSIGMLMDLNTLLNQPLVIGLATLGVMAVKTVTGGAAALILGSPLRVALPVGLALCQVGEFSFILSDHGLRYGLLSPQAHQIFLVVSVITMMASPAALAVGDSLGLRLGSRSRQAEAEQLPEEASKLSGHVIVIGFGFNGRNVARACQTAGIPYLVLEMNPHTVRSETRQGEQIIFGDAINPAVLEHVGAKRARILVATIADPVATRSIVATARGINPDLHIIARTRYVEELASLRELGADEVVPEEYETGVEIFVRVLRGLGVARNEINRLVRELRAEGYGLLREETPPSKAAKFDLADYLAEVELERVTVQEGSAMAGRTLGQLDLRQLHGITVLALRRQGEVKANPGAETQIQAGDQVVMVGAWQQLEQARALCEAPAPAA